MKRTFITSILALSLISQSMAEAIVPIGADQGVKIDMVCQQIGIHNNNEGIHRTPPQIPNIYFDASVSTVYFECVTGDGSVSHESENRPLTHVGPDNYVADWRDHLFVHEYGHYIQSQRWGDLFFPVIVIPSLISAGNRGPNHKNSWFEKDASALGGHYFDRKHGRDENGNVVSDEFHFNYKLFKSGGNTPYVNPRTGSQKQKGYFPEDEDNI